MSTSLSSEGSKRLLELVVRLTNRLDHPTFWEDVVCWTTSLAGFESGALLLPAEGSGWRRVAAIALQPEHERCLVGLTHQNGQREVPAAAHALPEGGIVVPCTSAAGALEALLVVFRPLSAPGRDADLMPHLGRVLGPIVGIARSHESARARAASAGRQVRRLHYLGESCAALSRAGGGLAALERTAALAGQWLGDRAVIEMREEAAALAGSYSICRLGPTWCAGRHGPPPDGERRRWLGKLMRTGEPILLAHLDPQQPGVPGYPCCGEAWPTGVTLSLLTVALRRRGRVIGALTVLRSDDGGSPYDREDLVFAREIARHTELALDYVSMERRETVNS